MDDIHPFLPPQKIETKKEKKKKTPAPTKNTRSYLAWSDDI